MKMLPGQSRRAYAIFMVIGAMALVVILLATVHGSVTFTEQQGALMNRRQEQAQATAALIALATTAAIEVGGAQTLTLTAPGETAVTAELRPLAPTDPLWAELAGLAPRDGDQLLTLVWPAGKQATPAVSYLINTAGKRRPVCLGRPGSVPAAAATPIQEGSR